MELGVIADTHDNVAAVETAVERFEDHDVDVVLHCGDFVAPPVVSHFEGFELHGVVGNNDGELDGLDRAFRSLEAGSLHGRFAELAFDGARFAMLHGERREEADELAERGDYEFVCYGHHHESDVRDVGGTTVLNPGAHFPTVPEEHRTVAIVDTDTHVVDLLPVV